MKVLFFGTPEFAEIVLSYIMREHEVVGVVCRSAKPTGRGKKLVDPNIANIARAKGIPVYQFENLKENLDVFKAQMCDVFVTASYGKILPKEILDMKLCINVHPSLLPKYRGATPIQSALLNGDNVTGVTIMRMSVGMDDGDIIAQEKCEIADSDDYLSLSSRLAQTSGELLLKVLKDLEKGKITFTKQDESKATKVKLIKGEDAYLDFRKLDSATLVNMVRAYVYDPVAYFFIGNERVKVFKAEKADIKLCPGEIYHTKKELIIGAKSGAVKILCLQVAGGKALGALDFLNGHKNLPNEVGEGV